MACFAGTLTVEPPFDESQVQFAGCSVSPDTIGEGQSATVDVEVTNNNDRDASVNVNVSVNGSFANEVISGTVGAGRTRTLRGTLSGLSQGSYDVEVEFSTVSPA